MIRTPWLAVASIATAAGALSGLARTAAADELRASREQPLVEVSHAVEIVVADGVATYKVRRQFSNPGNIADEAGLAIDLPAGAAATGLRIRAKDRWYDGELMERERAAALYKELTGIGAYAPKDPALLQWLWADKLYLQVFPVMPGGVSTVEYTLTVPTRYANGRYWVSYPRVDAAATTAPDRSIRPLTSPTITVRPAWGDATTVITIDGQRIAPETPMVLLPPARAPWQAVVPQDANASYVASTLEIAAEAKTTKPVATAELVLDIAHTYASDLRAVLVTPQGKVVELMAQSGGGANVLKRARPLTLPSGTTAAGTWRLVVSDHAGLDTGSIDQWSLTFGAGAAKTVATAGDTPVFIPDAPEGDGEAGVAAIAIAPPAIATWLGRFGRVMASDAHAFGRLEVDVAPQLSTIPVRAQVVFVVDASFSVGDERLAAQLDVIRAYLSHTPDAEVELVATRRRATRVFSEFVPAAQLDTRLAKARATGALELGNGSALDDAAALAVRVLADRTGNRRGARRIVLLTDEQLRSRLSAPAALAALANATTDTTIHVVVPELGADQTPTLTREDSAALAALATKHRGIFARLSGLPAPSPKQLAPVALELVRPTRIEKLVVTGAKVDEVVLAEGSGIRLWQTGQTAKTVASRITLRGELWSTPVARTILPSATFTRATAAFVFGADEHQGLTPTEMMKVALLGGAVSPVTSYVAFEPGTRPSVIGLGVGILHASGTGSGYGVGGGFGGMRGASRPPDLAALVATQACVAKHQPPVGWAVKLDVETTTREIVDVLPTDTTPFGHCLTEATWATQLTPAFFAYARELWTITLRAPAP